MPVGAIRTVDRILADEEEKRRKKAREEPSDGLPGTGEGQAAGEKGRGAGRPWAAPLCRRSAVGPYVGLSGHLSEILLKRPPPGWCQDGVTVGPYSRFSRI